MKTTDNIFEDRPRRCMIDLQTECTLTYFIHTPIGANSRKNVSKITSHEDKYGQVCINILGKRVTQKMLMEVKVSLHKKIKFSIKDFFIKCDQIRSFLQIWSHLLKKSFMEDFVFCAVCKGVLNCITDFHCIVFHVQNNASVVISQFPISI